jgi:protein-disulfide isomerase
MAISRLAHFLGALTSKKGAMVALATILVVGAVLALAINPGQSPAALAQDAAAVPETPAASLTVLHSLTPEQRKEIEAIIKDYLVQNPEVLMEAQNALEAKMEKLQAERMQVAIKENAKELFQSTTAPVAGNPKGDVTLIEFFDYNCGYCKKAFPDVVQFLEKDKQLKMLFKEFPILSKGSEEASKVALAARLQGKYWEFHRAMFESPGQANEAQALKVAEKLGLDMARLKKDMASAEVKREIDETHKLAQKMGIQGTPHFLIGEHVIPGAPENLSELLAKDVDEVRKAGCKVC